MTTSTRETLYPGVRLGVKVDQRGVGPDSAEPEQPDRGLIEALRLVREQGYDELTAVERYDPDFSIDLSRCHTTAEVDDLLDRWYTRRTQHLDGIRAALKRTWSEHKARKDP